MGAQKSGTSSLVRFLSNFQQHIFMHPRELHFWNRESEYQDGAGLSKYLENFKSADESRINGEKTPGYLSTPEVPERVFKHFPKTKIIAIIRDPADRAYSAYWHGKRVGAIPSNASFGEVIRNFERGPKKSWEDVVTNGFYSQQLARYTDNFPSNQIKLVGFESVLKNSSSELESTLQFLVGDSVRRIDTKVFSFPKYNVARKSRFPVLNRFIYKSKLFAAPTKNELIRKTLVEFKPPEMKLEDRNFLKELYSEEASNINQTFGTKFDW
ncbi:MAG: hypothetical protein RLZZ426_248 [Actinomycetota bacterium]